MSIKSKTIGSHIFPSASFSINTHKVRMHTDRKIEKNTDVKRYLEKELAFFRTTRLMPPVMIAKQRITVAMKTCHASSALSFSPAPERKNKYAITGPASSSSIYLAYFPI